MHVSWFHDSGTCTWIEFASTTNDTRSYFARILRAPNREGYIAHFSGMRPTSKPGVLEVIDRKSAPCSRDDATDILMVWLREYGLATLDFFD